MGRKKKGWIPPYNVDDYTYEYFNIDLLPTDAQAEHIIAVGQLMHRVHKMLYDFVLVPCHRRHIERTPSYCALYLESIVESDSKNLSELDKTYIKKIGYDGFFNLVRMAAFEHEDRLSYYEEKPNKWLILNDEDKYCVFLNNPETPYFYSEPLGDFTVMSLRTDLFGLIKVRPQYKDICNKINTIGKNQFCIFPQITIDANNYSRCYLRVVLVTYSPVGEKPKKDKNFHKHCPYFVNDNWFFHDYPAYLGFPTIIN